MADMMRARHRGLGVVTDVPKTAHYLDNGWVEVDPATPSSEQERVEQLNAIRRDGPDAHTAAEVVAAIDAAPPGVAEEIVAAEKAGKARKSVLNAEGA